MKRLTRRQFLKKSSAAAAGMVLLTAGCATNADITPTPTSEPPQNTPVQDTATVGISPSPTPEPSSTATLPPTETVAPTPTVAVLTRTDVTKHFPDAPSRLVRARHSGVWSNNKLVPGALAQMLDASITSLTGLNDATEAWKALFDPGEKIVIKVNTIWGSTGYTPVPLVKAVTDSLEAAGIPPEQITIFDRWGYEMINAGFVLNAEAPGVRTKATEKMYTGGFDILGTPVKLSDILLNCDALINMPLVKQHGMAGVSFAMKNHYGTFDSPSLFHSAEKIVQAIPELNALPPIKDRTRLIIGSALTVVLGDAWTSKKTGDSIFMSFDPVAHDAAGVQAWTDIINSKGGDPSFYAGRANDILTNAVGLGLGTNDSSQIDLQEVNLS